MPLRLLLFAWVESLVCCRAVLASDQFCCCFTLPPPLTDCRYKGVVHAFSVVLAQDGVRGLWRGSLPAAQRAALVNLGELTT